VVSSILGPRPCILPHHFLAPPHHFLAGPPAPAVVSQNGFSSSGNLRSSASLFSHLVRLTDTMTLTRIVAHFFITHHGMYIIDAIIQRFFD